MEDKQILNTSEKSAEYRTNISGWVDRPGRFWGNDERMARWSGCTHVLCGCGKTMSKNYTLCDECKEVAAAIRYNEREKKEWDGETPLYDDVSGDFFFSESDLLDYIEEHECKKEDMRLLICHPIFLRKVEEDYFSDELPDEEAVLSGEILKALENLNAVVQEHGPVSWYPGKYAAKL